LACITASKKAFEAMIRQNSPDGKTETFIQRLRTEPTGKEADAYRLWMQEVLFEEYYDTRDQIKLFNLRHLMILKSLSTVKRKHYLGSL
jgi:hypothetical protein